MGTFLGFGTFVVSCVESFLLLGFIIEEHLCIQILESVRPYISTIPLNSESHDGCWELQLFCIHKLGVLVASLSCGGIL
jgi:hypothetical protein